MLNLYKFIFIFFVYLNFFFILEWILKEYMFFGLIKLYILWIGVEWDKGFFLYDLCKLVWVFMWMIVKFGYFFVIVLKIG